MRILKIKLMGWLGLLDTNADVHRLDTRADRHWSCLEDLSLRLGKGLESYDKRLNGLDDTTRLMQTRMTNNWNQGLEILKGLNAVNLRLDKLEKNVVPTPLPTTTDENVSIVRNLVVALCDYHDKLEGGNLVVFKEAREWLAKHRSGL